MLSSLSFSLLDLRSAYLSAGVSPREVMAEVGRRILAHADPAVWIHLLTAEETEPYLERLDGVDPASLPLFGLPFAIKDNLDLAGVPTTAGCPAFAYVPTRSAAVVQRRPLNAAACGSQARPSLLRQRLVQNCRSRRVQAHRVHPIRRAHLRRGRPLSCWSHSDC